MRRPPGAGGALDTSACSDQPLIAAVGTRRLHCSRAARTRPAGPGTSGRARGPVRLWQELAVRGPSGFGAKPAKADHPTFALKIRLDQLGATSSRDRTAGGTKKLRSSPSFDRRSCCLHPVHRRPGNAILPSPSSAKPKRAAMNVSYITQEVLIFASILVASDTL